MKRKLLVTLLATSIALSLVLAGIGTTASAKEIKWRAQSLFGPQNGCTTIQARMVVDATNEALKGKLHTTLYPAGQIVPEEEMVSALARGVYDAGLTVPVMRSNAGNVAFGLPYGWESFDDIDKFFYEYGGLKFMRELEAKNNIFFCGPLPWGTPVPLVTTFPVKRLEDLKGKKIWSEGSTAALVAKLGGEPVWFPPAENYMALKLGTMDGLFIGIDELMTEKYYEVIKYVIFPAPFFVSLDWIISMDSWKALTSDMQKTYEAAFRSILRAQWEGTKKLGDDSLAYSKGRGVQVITLEPAEVERWKAAGMAIWDEIAKKDAESATGIEIMKAYLRSK